MIKQIIGDTIKKVILQSNNAARYSYSDLIYGISLVSKAVGLPVIMFIYTETQDGKGLIDAHFLI